MLRKYISRNPFTQKVVKEFPFSTPTQLNEIVNQSHEAFLKHSRRSFSERAALNLKIADILEREHKDVATIIAEEMGKPVTLGRMEVLKCAAACRYFAEHAEKMLGPTEFEVDGAKVYTRHDPTGPLLLIMPFNFPIWMPFKSASGHLMAGNTIILKHTERTPRVAEAIDAMTTEAGLEHEFKVIYPKVEDVESVIANPKIVGTSLTGSVGAGKLVASLSGKYMKKSVSELGGSDPFIVLADANIKEAAKAGVANRLMNTGQVCISSKRFIVDESIVQDFTDAVMEEMKLYEYSDPTTEECKLGPMAGDDLADNIERQLKQSVEMGAKLQVGGDRTAPNMITPAVLTDVTQDMPVFAEETFGPILPIVSAKNAEHALEIANNTEYGLSSVIYTGNPEYAETHLAPKLDAGAVFVNSTSQSYIPVPFGGTKQSGVGREMGPTGIKEFTNEKVVSVKK